MAARDSLSDGPRPGDPGSGRPASGRTASSGPGSGRPASIRMMWAQTSDGVIGDGDSMPWHIPEDLAHFRDTTMGAPVIMGRRTWDSLPERFRPLPGRRNIVLSRSLAAEDVPGAELAHSIESALVLLADVPVAWIIGGGRVYREALRLADECEVTEVDGIFEVDTPVRAPELHGWKPVRKGDWTVSSNGPRFRFTTWRPRAEEDY